MDPNRLNKMLSRAKAVMKRVDEGEYSTGNVTLSNVDGTQLVEQAAGTGEMVVQNRTNVAPQVINGQAQYKNMATSKLPENIKKAMMEQPIPQVNLASTTFTLADVDTELVANPTPIQNQQPRRIQESIQHNDSFTVSEAALRGIIKDIVKDELLSFMNETYAKTLSEQAIKKTMNVLIKEGKIAVKKKPVNG